MTREKIENWRVEFIKRKGVDPLSEKSARISANSFIRRARSLFSKSVARVRDLVELPEPLPFAGSRSRDQRRELPRHVRLGSLSRARATNSLTITPSNSRSSCSRRWRDFEATNRQAALERVSLRRGLIRIEATEHFRPKTHDSEGDVMVDPELLEIFRGYHARAAGDFVIEASASLIAAVALRSLSLRQTSTL